MILSEAELSQLASSRYEVTVIGGDAVFLVDSRLGHKLYMGCGKRLSRLELRRYVLSLNSDLHLLPMREFFEKYGLCG